MVLYRYTPDLPGLTELLNNYIIERGRKRGFIKTSGKDHMGVFFTHTQDKYNNDKNKTNRKGCSHWFHFRKKYHWEAVCPEL